MTAVAELDTIKFALRRPINAMKRPMPAATAACNSCGMAASRRWRRPVKVQKEEEKSGEEDGAEGGLPRDMHAEDDGVGEVGVEAHAGGEGERVVGEGAHENGAEAGAEARGDGDGGERHAGLVQDGGVDEDDVRHGDKGGEAGEGFGAPGGAVVREVEVSLEVGSKAWHHGLGQVYGRGWPGAVG